MAYDETFTIGSSRFEAVFAFVSLWVLLFACCWMLGSFAYHGETDAFPYALFGAELCLSGWGIRLAFRRVTMPAELIFNSSSLTFSYACHSTVWLWSEIETAYVVPTRRSPHVVLEFKPMHPSQIVPLAVDLNYSFNANANFIRDEIIERSCASGTNDGPEQCDL